MYRKGACLHMDSIASNFSRKDSNSNAKKLDFIIYL